MNIVYQIQNSYTTLFTQGDVEHDLGLTLGVVLRVVHGEEQREGGAHRLLATATQAAVLHFTSKQLSNDRLSRGAQRTSRHS